MSNRIVLAGALAQRPGRGGHAWVFLQYLLGFKRLGWDVLFIDQLQPGMCVDAAGQPCSLEGSENLRYLLDVLRGFGLENSFGLLDGNGQAAAGLSKAEILGFVASSEFLINVMGYLTDPELLAAARRLVFLDIDPGFGQMWRELGLADIFAGHEIFVTIGQNIGQSNCSIPTCGLKWITTCPPVVMEYWPVKGDDWQGHDFTSVSSWRGAFDSIEYANKRYGLRVHEFRKFMELPELARRRFRLALDIHPAELGDLALLAENGWVLEEPRQCTATPAEYRKYIERSAAEFMVAKNMYVDTCGGWFSDRSVCYLASGKPVLAQDTGWRQFYPADKGLLSFSTLDEARLGVEQIANHYQRHALAARSIAEQYFDSDRVLSRLLHEIGGSP